MKKGICLILTALCLLGLTACGETVQVTPDMQQVYDAMKDQLPAMEIFPAEVVLDAYGIESADCKQMVVSSYYDGADTAEIWLIEATDAAAAEEILELVQMRLTSLTDQFRNYDAAAYQLVKDAEPIIHGNCIALIVAEEAEDLIRIYKDAAQLK